MAVEAQLGRENMGLPSPLCVPGFNIQEYFPFHLQQNAQSLASMADSHSLDALMEIQRQELECFLHLQNERLRSALMSMESKAMYLMNRKEEDLVRATKKKTELEACLRRLEMEKQSWQRLAEANESMVMDLNKRLEHFKESLIWVSNPAEDEGSVFCNRDIDEQEIEKKIMACKHCNSGSSCVVFLPCRHLCSCKSCEPFLVSCPVCESVKEASIKVFWGV